MDDLFSPPTEQWRRLSPKYVRLKLLMIVLTWPLFFAALSVLAGLFAPWPTWLVVAGLGVLVLAWRLLRIPRFCARWGYAETDDDVYLTRGLMWRELTCVPYGRMQVVNVSSGPIERAFGLATVEMITASTDGTISIPGLERPEAVALRDRLIERGESLQAGI
ncbi:MAG: PH domain-containing protein [Arachnia sp.]